MEPLEYCELYVKTSKPGKRGYRAACAKALSEATFGFYSQQTILKKWGGQFERRPDAALKVLEIAHTLNYLNIVLEQIQVLITKLLELVSKIAPYKQHK